MSRDCTTSDAEAKFMAEFALGTLLALYKRFKLDRRLRLRNVDSDIIIGGDVAAAFKFLHTLGELSTIIREILRRMSAIVIEELGISGSARGRIAVRLASKYLPMALPVYRTKLELETPANLLLAATLIELRNQLRELVERLPSAHPLLELLRESAVENLRELMLVCEYLLYEPVLKSLLVKAQLIAGNPRRLEELEREVELEALRRPRELRAYLRLLELRKLLGKDLQLLREEVEELGKTLTLSLSFNKLYELYGLSLLLIALVEVLRPKRIKVACNERELRLYSNLGTVSVFYNALPESLESRVARAKAMGLIDGELGKEISAKLRGLPDTVVVRVQGNDGRSTLLLLDYKYTRNYSYLSQARFKMLAYLYEFNVNYGVVVAPRPQEGGEEDDEAYEHKGFYDKIAEYQGAYILIDNNGKVLAIVYADPCKDAVESSVKALKVIIKLLLISNN